MLKLKRLLHIERRLERPWGYPDTFTFPKAPCAWLCKRTHLVKRFHLSCLTCPLRRFTFKKRGYEKLAKYKRVIMVLESASGKGFVLPKRYRTYGLIFPQELGTVRKFLLKALITLAERIAEA